MQPAKLLHRIATILLLMPKSLVAAPLKASLVLCVQKLLESKLPARDRTSVAVHTGAELEVLDTNLGVRSGVSHYQLYYL